MNLQLIFWIKLVSSICYVFGQAGKKKNIVFVFSFHFLVLLFDQFDSRKTYIQSCWSFWNPCNYLTQNKGQGPYSGWLSGFFSRCLASATLNDDTSLASEVLKWWDKVLYRKSFRECNRVSIKKAKGYNIFRRKESKKYTVVDYELSITI